jgi:L-lactate utilization protein LutB
MNFDKDFDKQILSLNFFNEISDATKQDLLNELSNNPEYPNLRKVTLKIKGSDTKSYELISGAYQDARDELKESKNVISGLQLQVEDLKKEITTMNQQIESKSEGVHFSSLARDAKIRFNDLQYFGFAKMLESNDFIKVDTISIANVKWNPALSDSLVKVKEKQLGDWLKQELKTDNIIIKHN